jgi:ribosome-binding factor A
VTQRTERVDQLLREEIGAILTRDVGDPRIGFATITDVETAPDLRNARVWVSVIGSPQERTATIAALERAMPFIRRELGRRLRIRRIPEFQVRLDDSSDRGTRVLRLLQELEEGQTPDAEPPVDETLPTPVPRLPHEGDAPSEALTGEDEAPVRPPRRRRASPRPAKANRARRSPRR